MATAKGDCHVCGSEEVPVHILAACDRCRAAASRFSQQPGEARTARKGRRGAAGSWEETFCCSFCGRPPAEVRKIFSGPWSFICDGCVMLAMDAMREELGDLEAAGATKRDSKTWPGHAVVAVEGPEITEVGPMPSTGGGGRRTGTHRKR